jgi:hypothetical protein
MDPERPYAPDTRAPKKLAKAKLYANFAGMPDNIESIAEIKWPP